MAGNDTRGWGYFYRGAGGRFTEDPAPEMAAMQDETVPLKGIHLFDKAHAVMLTEQGILTRETGAAILQAFLEMDKEGYKSVRQRVGGAGHSGEAYLTQKLGIELGGQLHVGRSSGDLLAVTIRVEERDRILEILSSINLLCRTLLTLAQSHVLTVMPTYTHFQQAQAGTLAHYLLSWVYAFCRDFDRFDSVYTRINASPAGAAIGTGAPFPLNRERVADLLGFDTVLQNTRDAIFGFDRHLEVFSTLAILDVNLARLCGDLYIWSSHEFDMVELKDRFCGTSSINAGKKNPQALEQVQALSALATGGLMTAFAVDRMPSEAWEIEWRVWSQALWPLLRRTIQALNLMKSVLETLEIKADHMGELAGAGWIIASDLAAALVKAKGLPWRVSHQIVAELVRTCIERGLSSREITSTLLDDVAERRIGKKLLLDQCIIDKACDPLACAMARELTGGSAVNPVAKQFEDCQMRVSTQERRVASMEKLLTGAESRLGHAINALLH